MIQSCRHGRPGASLFSTVYAKRLLSGENWTSTTERNFRPSLLWIWAASDSEQKTNMTIVRKLPPKGRKQRPIVHQGLPPPSNTQAKPFIFLTNRPPPATV